MQVIYYSTITAYAGGTLTATVSTVGRAVAAGDLYRGTPTHSHTHKHTPTHIHTHTHSHTLTHSHTHTRTHTHTLSHTHTQWLQRRCLPARVCQWVARHGPRPWPPWGALSPPETSTAVRPSKVQNFLLKYVLYKVRPSF